MRGGPRQLAGAICLDLGHYGATAYANREMIPGMSSGGDGSGDTPA